MEERSSSGYGTVELDEATRSAVSELDELVGRRSRPSACDGAAGSCAQLEALPQHKGQAAVSEGVAQAR